MSKKPSLLEQMQQHSAHLWTLHHDGQKVIRCSPSASPVVAREHIVNGYLIPTEVITREGRWLHRPTRAEAEAKADLAMGMPTCLLPPPVFEKLPPPNRDLDVAAILASLAAEPRKAS